MSQLFSLSAQSAGAERQARAETDGFGITLYLDGQPTAVRSGIDAVNKARDYIGEFLKSAERHGFRAWGLLVAVPDGQAVYGEWPLVGGGGGSPSFQNTPLFKIRNRWHDSGPISALENAVAILREYTPRGGRGRMAA